MIVTVAMLFRARENAWVGWASLIAVVGSALATLNHVRAAIAERELVDVYLAAESATQESIAPLFLLLDLDPVRLEYLTVVVWLVTINAIAWRTGMWSRTLAGSVSSVPLHSSSSLRPLRWCPGSPGQVWRSSPAASSPGFGRGRLLPRRDRRLPATHLAREPTAVGFVGRRMPTIASPRTCGAHGPGVTTVADIKSSIESAIAYLSEHPDEARYTDSIATATLGESLRVTVEGSDGSIVTDMPTGVGGLDEHASPGWLFRAAVASCVASVIGMEAARARVTLSELVVNVDSESDDRGILRMDDDATAGPMSMSVRVSIAGDADATLLEEIAQRGAAHCPVCDAVKRTVPVEVDVATSPSSGR